MKTIYPLSSTATLEIASGTISNQIDLEAVVIFLSSRLDFIVETASGDPCRSGKAAPDGIPAIFPGQAIVSTHLVAKSPLVIACLPPVFGIDLPSDTLLENCYRNAIALAESHHATSIGFSGLAGTGFYYPTENAAETALRTVIELAPTLKSLRTVRFLLSDSFSLRIYREACNHMLGLIT
ncbi:MAG: macro domain-containing protein [Terrimicrobiaceae bacterium]